MRDTLIIHVTPEWQRSLSECRANYGLGWVPARPLGFASIWYRIEATWLVWTGRADALVWPAGQ